jgi:hypothetical protein
MRQNQGMSDWISQNWLALIATVAAVAAIPVSVLAARTWGNRRRKSTYIYSTTPLIARQANKLDKADIAVTLNGEPIEGAHLIRVIFINLGPSDITPGHFINQDSLYIEIGCKVATITTSSHPKETEADDVGLTTRIYLRPTLLKRGEMWSFSAITSGKPNPQITSTLVDTDDYIPQVHLERLRNGRIISPSAFFKMTIVAFKVAPYFRQQ